MIITVMQINPTVGALAANTSLIIQRIQEARKRGSELVIFPELAICGYPPEDLLMQTDFLASVGKSLSDICEATAGIGVIVGCVRAGEGEKPLYNTAAVLYDQRLLGFHDKILLPTYDVFTERRYFSPGGQMRLWTIHGKKIGILICEDMWQHSVAEAAYQRDPLRELQALEPDLVINLSASPYSLGRIAKRLQVCQEAVRNLGAPLILCNQVGGNDSLIFDGHSLCVDESGEETHRAHGFVEEMLYIEIEEDGTIQREKKPLPLEKNEIADVYQALVLGVRDYFHKQGQHRACIGISGGIDSAVVAAIAVEALGKEQVHALFLPSRYTRPESREYARLLADQLGIPLQEISIETLFMTYVDTLHNAWGEKISLQGTTEENLQARIRGMLLMAYANQYEFFVLGTANKSELAFGYGTLYGDLCGALSVLGDLTKERVYALAHWINRKKEVIPRGVIERPPSAELKQDQLDSDSLPPYEIVDRLVEAYVEEGRSLSAIAEKQGISLEIVKDLVRKIESSEYKRRQAPIGLRVTKKAFSMGRRIPIVNQWNK